MTPDDAWDDARVIPPPDAVNFAEWIERCEQLTDDGVWLLAGLAVGAAAKRALRIGKHDIEAACFRFANDMHILAGTPPPPSRFFT